MAKSTKLHKEIPQPVFTEDDIDPAPDHLNEEMAEVWKQTLMSLTPGWIGEDNYPILAAYCQHVVNARKIGRLLIALDEELETVDPLDPLPTKQLDSLLKMLDRENRAANASARSLRITNQSLRTDNSKKDHAKQSNAPWQS